MKIPSILVQITKWIAALLMLFIFLIIWVWADINDYFDSDYRDLSNDEMIQFKWKDNYDDAGKMLQKAFISQFHNDAYKFPRQPVSEVKLFRNIPSIGLLTGRKLNQKQMDSVLDLFNDPSNFDWGETTWAYFDNLENQYVFKFYNHEGAIVGKIDFCMKDWLTSSRPFSPRMKFRSLNKTGQHKLQAIVEDIRK
jgi:hypothetical protein